MIAEADIDVEAMAMKAFERRKVHILSKGTVISDV